MTLKLTPAEEQELKQLLAKELAPPRRKQILGWLHSSAKLKLGHARGRIRRALLAFLIAGSSSSGAGYLYGLHQLVLMFVIAGGPAAAIVLLGGDPNSYGSPLAIAPADDSAPATGEGDGGGA